MSEKTRGPFGAGNHLNFSFREGTTDILIFEEIFKYNGYKLPDRFSMNDLIVDIGAHIGFFTSAVVQRGGRNIYAFEVDNENYNLARTNLKDYINQRFVFLSRCAVWRSDISESTLYYNGYITDNNLLNTGTGDVIRGRTGYKVPAVSFDSAIVLATNQAKRRVRLLKLDCEGSEWPILLTSNTLHLIDEICGEFHELGGEYDTYTPPFTIEGFDRFTVHYLTQFLQQKGFNVTHTRARRADGMLSHLGTFFASRLVSNFTTDDLKIRPIKEMYQLPAANISGDWMRQVEQRSATYTVLRVFAGTTGWVKGSAFSPDGTKVLTGSHNGGVRIWDAASGDILAALEGHMGMVASVSFSPDGHSMLTGSYDGTARIWEAKSGRVLATLEGHTHAVTCIAFSPDGSKILTGSTDRTARLWGAAGGRLLATLQGYAEAVVNVAFSPDGSKMLIGSHNEVVQVRETINARVLMTLASDTNVVESAIFSPDGTMVFIGSSDRKARVWEVRSGRLQVTLEGHEGWVVSAAFSPEGTRILTGSYDGTARLWEIASGRLIAILAGHTVGVESVAFSQDGYKAITGSSDRTARLWNIVSGELLAILEGHTGWIMMVAFSPDGDKILTSSYDGTARLWKTVNGRLLAKLG